MKTTSSWFPLWYLLGTFTLFLPFQVEVGSLEVPLHRPVKKYSPAARISSDSFFWPEQVPAFQLLTKSNEESLQEGFIQDSRGTLCTKEAEVLLEHVKEDSSVPSLLDVALSNCSQRNLTSFLSIKQEKRNSLICLKSMKTPLLVRPWHWGSSKL